MCGGHMGYKEGTCDYTQLGEGKYSDEQEGSREKLHDGEHCDAHYDTEETCNSRVVSNGQGICGGDFLSWVSNPSLEGYVHDVYGAQIFDAHAHGTCDGKETRNEGEGTRSGTIILTLRKG